MTTMATVAGILAEIRALVGEDAEGGDPLEVARRLRAIDARAADGLAAIAADPPRACIVIGPGVWGKDAEEVWALRKAQQEYGGGRLPRYLVYRAHPEAVVEGDAIVSPAGASPPELIRRVVNGRDVTDRVGPDGRSAPPG